ncbi:MAG: hypothetical protein SFU98_14365 [Leptospiraceae bacterium]|nr:hypothetical protein [Leptospiraceae bacterium]
MNRFLIFGSYILFTTLVFTEEAKPIPKKKVKVTWARVKNATGYILEIQNPKKEIIYKQDTIENSLEPILAEGQFEKRLTVKNKLGEEIQGVWIPLKVKAPKKNEVIYEEKVVKPEIKEVKSNVSKWGIIIRSTLVPGMGQIYSGKEVTKSKFDLWRGYIYSGIFFTGILAQGYFINEYNSSRNQFSTNSRNSLLISALVPETPEIRNPIVLINYQMVGNRFQELESQKSIIEQGALFLGLVYCIQAIDSIILQRKVNQSSLNDKQVYFNFTRQKNGVLGVEDYYAAEYRLSF